ncbi:MAG: GerMN domain-containing protein [Deltaproteobacteria bacterium]|nr:GerMN domain-containing protein [Deltaproteobacteria bacterium]
MRRYGPFLLVVACVVTGAVFVFRHLSSQVPVRPTSHRQAFPKTARPEVYLYFSGGDESHLSAERRSMVLPERVVDRAKAIVTALIEGPTGPLTRTLPAETELLALYVDENGVGYVDFNKAVRDNHPGGSLTELLSIYSVVNSLCLNMPEIQAVKILIEGRDAQTLAGHIDIRYPLRADLLLVK